MFVGGLFFFSAGATGFEPAIFPVTGGRVNRATPRAHGLTVIKNTPKVNYRSISKNSFSSIIFTPSFFAFSYFDPGSAPATT
jgi:hypothetical protein